MDVGSEENDNVYIFQASAEPMQVDVGSEENDNVCIFQASAEPMQVDVGSEENDNVEEVQYIVENTSLVSIQLHIRWV